MKSSVYSRILRRELGDVSHSPNIRGLYGAKEWIQNLDIVNELGGHTGCVNALRYTMPHSSNIQMFYMYCHQSYGFVPSLL
jgi:hypothetical protein